MKLFGSPSILSSFFSLINRADDFPDCFIHLKIIQKNDEFFIFSRAGHWGREEENKRRLSNYTFGNSDQNIPDFHPKLFHCRGSNIELKPFTMAVRNKIPKKKRTNFRPKTSISGKMGET